MLQRRKSKSQQRRPLGRSKSTNSISTRPVYALHRDPVSAERDAHIAARLSYQRAQGRQSEGMAVLPERPASSFDVAESNISRHDFACSESARSQTGGPSNAPGLARQQSVRFTGPNAQPRRTLGSRASERKATSSTGKKIQITSHPDHQTHHPFEEKLADNPNVLSSYMLHGLQTADRQHMSEDDIVLMPSSYRRLRKSRSMFNASDPTFGGYSFTNSPTHPSKTSHSSRYASLNEENKPKAMLGGRTLRAPKSTGFLRSRRNNKESQASSQPCSQAQYELAVQLARDKYRDQADDQPNLKSHASIFFRSRARRTDSSMGLRKSLRNSSTSSAVLSSAFSGDSLSVPKHGSLRSKARKVSHTIKTRLKGIFSRQHAQRELDDFHEGQTEDDDIDTEDYLNLESPQLTEGASMSRGPSRIAALHAVPSWQQLKSRQGSLDSCSPEDKTPDDRSRVTSWTDSTNNTVASPASATDRAHPRLSVIKENGAHASSSATLTHARRQSITPSKGIAVDSQRIYSALMRRAQEAEKSEKENRKQSIEDTRACGRAPPRSSSVDQVGCSGWSPPTIRCVPSEDDVFQDDNDSTLVKDRSSFDTVISSRPRMLHPQISRTGSPNPWLKGNAERYASPGKSSLRSQASRSNTLTQRSSAFFASPSSHFFRTASPFRRALQESMKTSEGGNTQPSPGKWKSEYLGSLSAISLPDRQISTDGSGSLPGRYTNSVYSSQPSEDWHEDPCTEESPEPLSQTHGAATIFLQSQTHRASQISPQREISGASSVEWKTWLSSHVSRLEGTGHVRENAEIESKDDPIRSSPKSQPSSKRPTPLKSLPVHSRPSSARNIRSPRTPTPGVENEAPSSEPWGRSKPNAAAPSQMSSKEIVEIFLNSRRDQTAETHSSPAFV